MSQAVAKLSPRQSARRLSKAATQVILGRKKSLSRWCRVLSRKDGSTRIYLTYTRKTIAIDGFAGYQEVFCNITKEKTQVVARFYPDETAAQLIKTVVLSEKTKGRWMVLEKPRVIFTCSSAGSQQHVRLETKRIRDFLLTPQEEGAVLDLAPRRVNCGSIAFLLEPQREDPPEGAIYATGYTAYEGQRLSGRIVVEGDQKRVCFWLDETSRDQGLPHIPAQNIRVMAEKKQTWQIKWHVNSPARRQKKAATIRYGHFLFAAVNGRIFQNPWLIHVLKLKGRTRRQGYLSVRGKRLTFELPKDLEIDQLWGVTRQIGAKFKLVEFWPSQQAYQSEESPFAARFITFRANGEWTHFWARLDEKEKFITLLEEGTLSWPELEATLNDPHLARYQELSWINPVPLALMGTPGNNNSRINHG